MYRIVTRTKRIVCTGIQTLNEATRKLRQLELEARRAGVYSYGYYQIKKEEQNG